MRKLPLTGTLAIFSLFLTNIVRGDGKNNLISKLFNKVLIYFLIYRTLTVHRVFYLQI